VSGAAHSMKSGRIPILHELSRTMGSNRMIALWCTSNRALVHMQ
jgi:hypothetical protein